MDPTRRILDEGIFEALHPSQGCRCEYRIDPEDLRDLKHKGIGKAREVCVVVPQILIQPTAIFRGLVERGEEWLCYAGLPDRAYDYNTGQRLPPWPDEVFLAFFNANGYYYNSWWETADPVDSGIPHGTATRFISRVR